MAEEFRSTTKESIDYAICLNSVGSWTNELWLHVSKPPENVYIEQIFDGIFDVAEELGIAVGVKHKRLDCSWLPSKDLLAGSFHL